MKNATMSECNIVELPRIENRAGNITVVENGNNFPFEVKRIFYIYDIPGGKSRGAHAHKMCHLCLVAVSGSFSVSVFDGQNQKIITLDKPYYGLHIPPGIWSNTLNFSSGAICLVLTSELYNSTDYIRDYSDFLLYCNDGNL